MGAARSPVVKVEGGLVRWAVRGFSKCSSLRKRLREGAEQRAGAQEVSLLFFLRIFYSPYKTKLLFEWHKSHYLVLRTSRRKQDLSIWLNTFSKSLLRRHRPSSLPRH